MTVRFEAREDTPGFRVRDDAEGRELPFRTPERVALEAADTTGFPAPVDAAVSVETTAVTFDRRDYLTVRERDGEFVAAVEPDDPYREQARVERVIGVSSPVRCYLRVTGPFAVEVGTELMRVSFESPSTVTVGARSLHRRPAATVTTTDDLSDLAVAVSSLSSALKTTAPERSYPTMRGHPPLLERGDALSVPASVQPAEAAVELVVPPERGAVYAVAPLAYYLGADVCIGAADSVGGNSSGGARGVVSTPAGTRPLDEGRSFEDAVAGALKRAVLVDGVVRSAGAFAAPVVEEEGVLGVLDADGSALYDAPSWERFEAALGLPEDVVDSAWPYWGQTAYVAPEPGRVGALPFAVDALAVVREPSASPVDHTTVAEPRVTPSSARSQSAGADRRSAPSFVEPDAPDDALATTWFDDAVAVGATNGVVDGYLHGLSERDGSGVNVLVACTDPVMLEESGQLDAVYDGRLDVSIDVERLVGPSPDDLATALTGGDHDFLHFVGHVTDDGLQCVGGTLDAATLEDVAVDSFLLNGCASFRQARALVEAGAAGGVGTFEDVLNRDAITVGRTMARLFRLGFTLSAALHVVREYSPAGRRYLVVGDGRVQLAQEEGGASPLYRVTTAADGGYRLDAVAFPTRAFGVGVSQDWQDAEDVALLPSVMEPQSVTAAELRAAMQLRSTVLAVDGDLHFTDSLEELSL